MLACSVPWPYFAPRGPHGSKPKKGAEVWMMTQGVSTSVNRHLLPEHRAIVAVADFAPLFEQLHEHLERWRLPADPFEIVVLHQALAGAALQLSFRPPAEATAWTLNLHRPPLNVFVTGGGPDEVLTGRLFTDGVQTTGESRLYVQRRRAQHSPTLSSVAVVGLDVLEIYEQFFQRSEQLPTRLLELSSTEMVMVQALPGADPQWVAHLDGAAVRQRLADRPEELEQRLFRLYCGCTAERIAETLVGMFLQDPDTLFQGDAGVETHCPRCGARWWIDRELFERAAAGPPRP